MGRGRVREEERRWSRDERSSTRILGAHARCRDGHGGRVDEAAARDRTPAVDAKRGCTHYLPHLAPRIDHFGNVSKEGRREKKPANNFLLVVVEEVF